MEKFYVCESVSIEIYESHQYTLEIGGTWRRHLFLSHWVTVVAMHFSSSLGLIIYLCHLSFSERGGQHYWQNGELKVGYFWLAMQRFATCLLVNMSKTQPWQGILLALCRWDESFEIIVAIFHYLGLNACFASSGPAFIIWWFDMSCLVIDLIFPPHGPQDCLMNWGSLEIQLQKWVNLIEKKRLHMNWLSFVESSSLFPKLCNWPCFHVDIGGLETENNVLFFWFNLHHRGSSASALGFKTMTAMH